MRPRATRAAKANPKTRSASFFALLLARGGRDTADVPGFDALADRQADLLELIVATPARGLAGPIAEVRCARLHPHDRGFDAAQALTLSAADDLLRLAGAGPSLPPSRPFPSGSFSRRRR